jgi:murein DD-endopeptidase MepM/ murein hydrolase activator NlpD
LSKQLLDAFERLQATQTTPPAAAAQNNIAVPPAPSPADPTAPIPSDQATPDVTPVAGSPTVPTVDGHVTSNFGWRRDPFTGQTRFHRGVDLAAVYGQDVQAARAGRVVFSGGQGGYGNTVVIEHSDGTRSRYAHLSAMLVSDGDMVDVGQPVGRAGHSGRATGTHVHFEVTSADGRPIAPDAWMKQS